jgi:hypothetical protein
LQHGPTRRSVSAEILTSGAAANLRDRRVALFCQN